MKTSPKSKLKVKNTLGRQFGDGGLKPGGENYQMTKDLFFRHEKLREIHPKTLEWYGLILNSFEKYLTDQGLSTAHFGWLGTEVIHIS